MNLDIRQPQITPAILRLVAEIDEFKGRWQDLGRLSPDRLAALRQVATIESIGSSTRIEGAVLTDQEVEALLSGLAIQSFRTRDEQEVAGYAEVMRLVFESHTAIPVNENYIKQLHGLLLKHAAKDARHRGEFKKLPNHVEAFDPDGHSLGVVFKTASPFETPALMASLMEWTTRQLGSGDMHPLLVISLFKLHFLAIHPFQDGNGRLSRILTTLLMLQQGYAFVPYSSLERVIEDNKDNYYRYLRRGQTDPAAGHEWIDFFLGCVRAQVRTLERRLTDEHKAGALPELSAQLLDLVRQRARLTVAEAVAITGANRNTVKAHLKRLVASRRLQLDGRGKGAGYRLAALSTPGHR